MFERLKNLNYDNFIELIEYLGEVSGKEDLEEKELFVEEKIQNFFPKLNAVQEIELSFIIKNKSQEQFELFRDNYPDLEIDVEGKSKPEDKQYWLIREKTLESVCDLALENLKENSFIDRSINKIDSQVYNAKNLSNLKNMPATEGKNYFLYRKLFLKKYEDDFLINNKNFNKYEKILKDLEIKEYNKFFLTLVNYIKEKKREEFSLFLEHLFERIELLGLDVDLTSSKNIEFKENILSIINK